MLSNLMQNMGGYKIWVVVKYGGVAKYRGGFKIWRRLQNMEGVVKYGGGCQIWGGAKYGGLENMGVQNIGDAKDGVGCKILRGCKI